MAIWSPRGMACINTINESKVIKRNRVPLLLYFENKKEDANPCNTYYNPISYLLPSPDPAATLEPPQPPTNTETHTHNTYTCMWTQHTHPTCTREHTPAVL